MTDLAKFPITRGQGGMDQLWCSMPQGRGPFPTVVILPTVAGVNDYIAGIATRLNANGFGAAALDYYGERAAPDLSTREATMAAVAALSDVDVVATSEAAAVSLMSHPLVDAEHLGLLGFCAGGSFALQVASSTARYRCVAMLYGVLRYADLSPRKPISPIDTIRESTVPLLGHFGDEDPFVDLEDVEELRRRTRGLSAEVHVYPGAGHGFHQHAGPGYRPVAAVEAWRRTLSFFDWHLRGFVA